MGMSLRPLAWLVGGGILAWGVSLGEDKFWVFPVYVLFVFISYVVSLHSRPDRPCWRCRGRGRFFGWFWSYGSDGCPNCGGSGRRPRFGTRFINRAARNT